MHYVQSNLQLQPPVGGASMTFRADRRSCLAATLADESPNGPMWSGDESGHGEDARVTRCEAWCTSP